MGKFCQLAELLVAELFLFTGLTFLLVRLNQRRGKIPIAIYHSVSEPPDKGWRSVDRVGMNVAPQAFEAQIKAFRRWFDIIPLSDFLAARDQKSANWNRSLVLTFDDGYRNNFDVAAPIIEKLGARATFYLIGPSTTGEKLSHLHALYRHIDDLSETGSETEAQRLFTKENRQAIILGDEAAGSRVLEREGIDDAMPGISRYFMDIDQTRTLARQGHEIAGHSTGHRLLCCLTDDDLRADLEECRATLSQFASSDSGIGFAYPYGMAGTTSEREKEAVSAAGFAYSVTTEERLLSASSDLYALPRIQMNNTRPAVALFRLTGLRGALKRPIQKFLWNRRMSGRTNTRQASIGGH